MATEFNETYYRKIRQVADRPALRYYARLARCFFRRGRILDFGCGTGHFLKRLRTHFQVDGFDISEFARTSSLRLVPDAGFFSSLEDIPSSLYAGITSLHVLEHATDTELEEILKTWRRALLPDGKIICVIPDIDGKGHRIKGKGWVGFRDPSHINLKDRETWKGLFSANGFAIERTGADGLWDFPYSQGLPRLLDAAVHSTFSVIQFLSGVLLLAEGAGESSIFILSLDQS